LAHRPHALTDFSFTLAVFNFYSRLIGAADAGLEARQEPSSERGLGGKLLWAGELDSAGRALVMAGNIAGAATLTATADASAQKHAVRDGIVDFLVTSLDEALRVLKNQIRKRETVAVCVGAALDAVEHEMAERGVRPDLFRESVIAASDPPKAQSDKGKPDSMGTEALVTWRVDSAPAQWLPKLDAIALDCLNADDQIARRWLRHAGRSMGRLGHGAHLLISDRKFAARMIGRVHDQVRNGDLRVRGQIQVSFKGRNEEHNFVPSNPSLTN
jgi:hypothetical protein